MKIVFMGTPEFAIPSLQILIDNAFEISAVITTPDKPAGRGNKMQSSAIKQFAEPLGLNIIQPEKLRDPDFVKSLQALNADVFFVIAFRMLPEIIWSMPPKGCVNLHGSLLPQYRGAAPIHWAVINGETETGVTTFFIEKEIDTGNIIAQKTITIPNHFTTGDLHDVMAPIGAQLVLETAQLLAEVSDKSQVHTQEQIFTSDLKIAPKIFTSTAQINWNQDAATLYNFIRGMSPYPCAHTKLNDKALKIFKAKLSSPPNELPAAAEVGTFQILNADTSKPSWWVRAKNSWLELAEVQLEGKKKMPTLDFLRGYKGSLEGIFREL